jgi:hypothetical protein
MDEDDRPALAPEAEGPVLDWQPGLGFVLFAVAAERREVVDYDDLGVIHDGLKLELAA